jgi:hypothetical protein
MPNYVYLQHYTSQGDLGISRDVFVTLGQHVVSYIREKNVGKGFTISDNVDVSIHSNEVVYKFFVTKKNKVNPHYIENCITDYINSNLLMICEVVPFEISVKVTSEAGE